MTVQGSFDPRFAAVADTLAASLASGADRGASVAMVLDGEMVVDVWGGFADAAQTAPWQQDTITNVWSTTKTMMALCAL
ncbi:MAG TPA: serine hydrolase domain-containing protein, partial [Ilumatobacteraceae bacterium]|nr:serine hydrolase domain-containing protein [Ilumatobacteraceae bacterium]